MQRAEGDPETFSMEDIAFHLSIARASRNLIYATVLRGLERRCIDYAVSNHGNGNWYARVIETHDEIVRAIKDGNADAAASSMCRHLLLSRRHYIDVGGA
jgi:DNA-binding FadR family transcriptional regulator